MEARFPALIVLLVISAALITIVVNPFGGGDTKGDGFKNPFGNVKPEAREAKPHPYTKVGAIVPNLVMLFKPNGAEPEEFANPEITIRHTHITLNGKRLPLDAKKGPTYFTAFNSKSLNMAFLSWGEETLLVFSFKQRQNLQKAVQVFKSIAAKQLPFIGNASPPKMSKDMEEYVVFYAGVGFAKMRRDKDLSNSFSDEEQIFDVTRPFPVSNEATTKFKHVRGGGAAPESTPGVVLWDKSVGMVMVMAMYPGTPLPFTPRYQKKFVFLKDFLKNGREL